jgi:spore maturation protein CgeB
MADNICIALLDMGVEATLMGAASSTASNRKFRNLANTLITQDLSLATRFQRGLVVNASEENYDLIISIDQKLTPESVKCLKQVSRKVVFWFGDATGSMSSKQTFLSAPYDHLYLKDRLTAYRYSDLLAMPVSYLPEACNPRRHTPISEYGTSRRFVLAGTMYPYRVRLLHRIAEDGIPLSLYGPTPPSWVGADSLLPIHAQQTLLGKEKARIFRGALGVLNPSHPYDFALTNCRLFEAAGSGAVCITELNEDLKVLFEVGDEVLAYSNYKEMALIFRRLLEDPVYGEKIADAAALRAHEEHTYQHRLRIILNDNA